MENVGIYACPFSAGQGRRNAATVIFLMGSRGGGQGYFEVCLR